MSKKLSTKSATKTKTVPGYSFVSKAGSVYEYKLKSNNLRVLYHHKPNTGVVTTNITYLVGSRDEKRGETGVAHMLEHMMFKPTTFDKKNRVKGGSAMEFERKTGCIINANTWKDRTTYYFSYPAEYFKDALKIEAERMVGTIINKQELDPEQGNVLSEFDMYNGDPAFALDVQMVSTAFQSHPYGHETIGYREDIEDYNPEKLQRFFHDYYRPDNAVMMVIGDIELNAALNEVKNIFGKIKNPTTPIPRFSIREPKQEGLRRVSVERPSTLNIVSLGFKHAGFPSPDWFTACIMLDVLTSGPESILHKKLIDTSEVASLSTMIEPTDEENIASLKITLLPGKSHQETEEKVLNIIRGLKASDIALLIKKVKAGMITEELFSRTSSLQIARELTEYVAAGEWQTYGKTTKILEGITTKKVMDCLQQSFTENNMTIGYFIGKA